MARPTSRRKSEVATALIELRRRLDDSQQAFSNRLGVALQTIARYESSRDPAGEVLLDISKLASMHGHKDLARFFGERYVEGFQRVLAELVTIPAIDGRPACAILKHKLYGEDVDFGRIFMFAIAALHGPDADTKAKVTRTFAAMAKAIEGGRPGSIDYEKIPTEVSVSPTKLIIHPEAAVDQGSLRAKSSRKRAK